MSTMLSHTKQEFTVPGIRINRVDTFGKEVARATLFLLRNNLHRYPYGLLEDVFVHESHRKKGIAQ
jgi:GNAT superfamily N-acetyltransferase